MEAPNLTINEFFSISMYSDPNKASLSKDNFVDTLVSDYEFRFFPADWPGGITIDSVFYAAQKGCFSICKPGQTRRLTTPLQCYYIYISTTDAQLQQALESLPAFGAHPQMDEILAICRKIKRTIVDRNTLEARMEMSACVYDILVLLLRQQNAITTAVNGNPRRHQQALLKADRYLREHICEDIDLAKLAQESHLSPTYFHKLFTAAFGKTPAQQLEKYRHWAAKDYLRDDDCPLAEIARKCGYSSQSYFCYKFKQLEGMTPSTYRSNRRWQRKRNKGNAQ